MKAGVNVFKKASLPLLDANCMCKSLSGTKARDVEVLYLIFYRLVVRVRAAMSKVLEVFQEGGQA